MNYSIEVPDPKEGDDQHVNEISLYNYISRDASYIHELSFTNKTPVPKRQNIRKLSLTSVSKEHNKYFSDSPDKVWDRNISITTQLQESLATQGQNSPKRMNFGNIATLDDINAGNKSQNSSNKHSFFFKLFKIKKAKPKEDKKKGVSEESTVEKKRKASENSINPFKPSPFPTLEAADSPVSKGKSTSEKETDFVYSKRKSLRELSNFSADRRRKSTADDGSSSAPGRLEKAYIYRGQEYFDIGIDKMGIFIEKLNRVFRISLIIIILTFAAGYSTVIFDNEYFYNYAVHPGFSLVTSLISSAMMIRIFYMKKMPKILEAHGFDKKRMQHYTLPKNFLKVQLCGIIVTVGISGLFAFILRDYYSTARLLFVVCLSAIIMGIFQYNFFKGYGKTTSRGEFGKNHKSIISDDDETNVYHEFMLELYYIKKGEEEAERRFGKRTSFFTSFGSKKPSLSSPGGKNKKKKTTKEDIQEEQTTRPPVIIKRHIIMCHLFIILMAIYGFSIISIYEQIMEMSKTVLLIMTFAFLPLSYVVANLISRISFFLFRFRAGLLCHLVLFFNMLCPYKVNMFCKNLMDQIGLENMITIVLAKIVWKVIIYGISLFNFVLAQVGKKEVIQIQDIANVSEQNKRRKDVSGYIPRNHFNFVITFSVWQILDMTLSIGLASMSFIFAELDQDNFIVQQSDVKVYGLVAVLIIDFLIETLIFFVYPKLLRWAQPEFKNINIILNTFLYLKENAFLIFLFVTYAIFMAFYHIQVYSMTY